MIRGLTPEHSINVLLREIDIVPTTHLLDPTMSVDLRTKGVLEEDTAQELGGKLDELKDFAPSRLTKYNHGVKGEADQFLPKPVNVSLFKQTKLLSCKSFQSRRIMTAFIRIRKSSVKTCLFQSSNIAY